MLFEWCLECSNLDGVDAVRVDRDDSDGTVDVILSLDFPDGCESVLSNQKFKRLLEQLEQWVGGYTSSCTSLDPVA